MTDQTYDEREDERDAGDAARGQTEREEEGKPYSPEESATDDEEPQ